MKTRLQLIVAMGAFCATLPLLVGAQPSAGYVEPARFKKLSTVTFANQTGADTQRFQRLIDSVEKRGGVIWMKSSDESYVLGGIVIPSNVHIRMEAGVHIQQDPSMRKANVFTLMGDDVSIVGASASQKAVIEAHVDLASPDATSFRAVSVQAAKNFWLANLMIEEKDTRFSTIMTKNTAVGGTIEDITMRGAGPGWGLLQMQGGSDIVARNLDGQGGFTLRLEQGSATAPVGIQNLHAKNIIGRHARAAVLIAPKSKVNGYAVIENVESYGCQWAVLASRGKEGGVFKKVLLKGTIVAHYDDHGSQFRTLSNKIKNPLFLPADLQQKVSSIPGYGRDKFSTGPAFGTMQSAAVDWIVIDSQATLERVGFPFDDPAVVTMDMLQEIVSKNGAR